MNNIRFDLPIMTVLHTATKREDILGYIETRQWYGKYKHIRDFNKLGPIVVDRMLEMLNGETLPKMKRLNPISNEVAVGHVKPGSPLIGNVLFEVDIYGELTLILQNLDSSD